MFSKAICTKCYGDSCNNKRDPDDLPDIHVEGHEETTDIPLCETFPWYRGREYSRKELNAKKKGVQISGQSSVSINT